MTNNQIKKDTCPKFPVEYVKFHETEAFNFQLNRLYSWGGVDKKEIFSVAKNVDDFESWISEMIKAAEKALDQNRYLDAAEFYRTGEFFTSPDDPQKEELYDQYQFYFYQAIANNSNIQKYFVPYKNIKLPILYMRSIEEAKETIVIHGGYDSFMEELYRIGLYFNCQGYDVVLFEGPGQGYVLHKEKMKMTHEWEKPTKAVLDFFQLDDVTMIGVSLGGYLCLRAGAFEDRIKRLVAFDILYDFFDVGAKKKGLINYWIINWFFNNQKKELFNKLADKIMKKAKNKKSSTFFTTWSIDHGMHVMGVDNPYDLLDTFKKYSLKKLSAQIKQDVLLLAGEEDDIPLSMYYEQKKALINAKSVSGRIFRREEQAAQHCQFGNTKLVLDHIINWLDNVK